MKEIINCLKEDNPVINKKLRKVSIDEGLSIAKDLFNILAERKDGIGLAANQVGIDASVAVVNVKEPLIAPNPSDGKGSWEKESSDKQDQELRLLETICVQHEIDHLNGMTIMDRQMITTIVNTEKFGRNEKVMITDGNETKELKWKKAKPLIDSGKWELYVGGPIT
jgi:peptide deformylase